MAAPGVGGWGVGVGRATAPVTAGEADARAGGMHWRRHAARYFTHMAIAWKDIVTLGSVLLMNTTQLVPAAFGLLE